MRDDPLQKSPRTPQGFQEETSLGRFSRHLLDDDGGPSTPTVPLASTSKATLEQLTRESRADKRLAFIHPVAKHDTLASVALSYGCSQTIIRQSNKLWISDPIHFRSELTIPLDACTKRPSRNVLVEVHLRLDAMIMDLSSYTEPSPAKPNTREQASAFAAMTAARVADFTGSASESSRGSSRGSSFDLLRIDSSSQNQIKTPSPSYPLADGFQHAREGSADSYLASTNNIYASDQIDDVTPLPAAQTVDVIPPPGDAAQEATPESTPPRPELIRRSFKLIEVPRASMSFSASPRPSLSSSRPSFQLDERLSSPPPPARSSNSSSGTLSTSRPPEAWALSSKRGSGGWAALDQDELDMARDIMRHVGQGESQVRQQSNRSVSRRRNGLSDVLAAWTS